MATGIFSLPFCDWKPASVYPKWGPITGSRRAYTPSRVQSQEAGEYIPQARSNHRRQESIYPKWGPITGGRRAYSALYLPVGDGQAVAGHHHHPLGLHEHLRALVDVGELRLRGGPLVTVAFARERLFGRGAAAEDHRGEGAVHRLAHDEGEDGAGGADERAHDGEHLVVEHEALRAQRPPGVRVQQGDDHGHVRASHGRRRVVPGWRKRQTTRPKRLGQKRREPRGRGGLQGTRLLCFYTPIK
eukprot:1183080-Prorocentrum_minimum.AAC.1